MGVVFQALGVFFLVRYIIDLNKENTALKKTIADQQPPKDQ